MMLRQDDVTYTYTETAIPICPTCYDDARVHCLECGDDYIACKCDEDEQGWYCIKCDTDFIFDIHGHSFYDEVSPRSFQADDGRWYWDDGTEAKCHCYKPKVLLCNACGVSRDKSSDHWNPWVSMINPDNPTAPLDKNAAYSYIFASCRHLMFELKLRETSIFLSSHNDTRATNIPDFGLYADWSWRPWWRNEHIDWRDFDVPTDYQTAYYQILDAYQMAKEGAIVEVGCVGGHGRTGTIAACMGVLDGMEADEAIKHVTEMYCSKVIETNEQEWFVKWVEAIHNGNPAPEKPEWQPKFSPPTQTNCLEADHRAMIEDGLEVCRVASCKTFPIDQDRYLKGSTVAVKTVKEIAEELRAQLALPLPSGEPDTSIPPPPVYPIGTVKDEFVKTENGWEPIFRPKKKRKRNRAKKKS